MGTGIDYLNYRVTSGFPVTPAAPETVFESPEQGSAGVVLGYFHVWFKTHLGTIPTS